MSATLHQTSTSMPAPAELVDLPAELVQHIATFLDGPSIKRLRLTGSEVGGKIPLWLLAARTSWTATFRLPEASCNLAVRERLRRNEFDAAAACAAVSVLEQGECASTKIVAPLLRQYFISEASRTILADVVGLRILLRMLKSAEAALFNTAADAICATLERVGEQNDIALRTCELAVEFWAFWVRTAPRNFREQHGCARRIIGALQGSDNEIVVVARARLLRLLDEEVPPVPHEIKTRYPDLLGPDDVLDIEDVVCGHTLLAYYHQHVDAPTSVLQALLTLCLHNALHKECDWAADSLIAMRPDIVADHRHANFIVKLLIYKQCSNAILRTLRMHLCNVVTFCPPRLMEICCKYNSPEMLRTLMQEYAKSTDADQIVTEAMLIAISLKADQCFTAIDEFARRKGVTHVVRHWVHSRPADVLSMFSNSSMLEEKPAVAAMMRAANNSRDRKSFRYSSALVPQMCKMLAESINCQPAKLMDLPYRRYAVEMMAKFRVQPQKPLSPAGEMALAVLRYDHAHLTFAWRLAHMKQYARVVEPCRNFDPAEEDPPMLEALALALEFCNVSHSMPASATFVERAARRLRGSSHAPAWTNLTVLAAATGNACTLQTVRHGRSLEDLATTEHAALEKLAEKKMLVAADFLRSVPV